MSLIGYHASHEEMPPGDLLACVQRAAAAGFAAGMCSDHLAPWSNRQGHSGHSWAWLGAALARTDMSFGVVTSPVGRQHPAVVAQAGATLAQMFPGRFWMALGSGEALNEAVTGEPWPPKPARDARLDEAAGLIHRLLGGERITHEGRVRMQDARVYSLPDEPPPLLAAAASATTARRVAGWADGLITFNRPLDVLRQVVEAWREGGGEGKPVHLQVHVSFAESRRTALEVAHHYWGTNVFPPTVMWELSTPEQFEAAAEHVRPDDMTDAVVVSDDTDEITERLQQFAEAGFDDIYLHQVGRVPEQERFIDAVAADVLPAMSAGRAG
jgi:probable non-F420 flavinoid oxidoreductase